MSLAETKPFCFESLKKRVKLKKFDRTSSTRLELQTLIWALTEIEDSSGKILVYTDSQNILGLFKRRARLEQKNYRSKKHKRINNYRLYQEFFRLSDQLDCEFIKMKGHKPSGRKDELDRLFTLVDRASRKALRAHPMKTGADLARIVPISQKTSDTVIR